MSDSRHTSRHFSKLVSALVTFLIVFLLPRLVFADFDSSLVGLQYKLTGFVLPTLAVMSIGFSAISLFTGSPNAKTHVTYAILGCVFAFGAQAIVHLLQGLVQ